MLSAEQRTHIQGGQVPDLAPADLPEAAALALAWGWSRLALDWAVDPFIRAAAFLRLGETAQARQMLTQAPASARRLVLEARAAALTGAAATLEQAEVARTEARREGDAAALIAAAVLCGEAQRETDPRQALRSLAEGLKVAEVTGAEADPHLLAVLAHVQRQVGSAAKARATAEKARARALPRSPALVVALLALGERAEAQAHATAGALAAGWWAGYLD